MTATGRYGAGIGGGSYKDGGEITIQGGSVTATGRYGAGIGGGDRGAGGKITIQGGTVTATGAYQGAGIGGGSLGAGGTITICGGTINAKGEVGAGIGGGDSRAGGTITICGGVITATGTEGAGIGGGQDASDKTTTVSGGTFQTQTGETSASKGNALIFASCITDTDGKASWNGLIVYDVEGGFYGTMTEAVIEDAAEILSGSKLTIQKGKKLTIKRDAILTNNGTLEVESGGSLINQGILANNGSLKIESGGIFDNSEGILQQNGTYDKQDKESAGQTAGTVQKRLVITNIAAEDKKYDGTDRVKVKDVTVSGIDEGDHVSVQTGEVSAVLDSSKPGTYTNIKSLKGKVALEGEDAGKYYVDLTQQDIPSVNGGKGVVIHKNMEKIVRTAADKSYLCTRDYSGSINITKLFDKEWGNIVNTTVKVLDEKETDIQETAQWTADIQKIEQWSASLQKETAYVLNYTTKAGNAGKRKLVTVVETEYYQNIEIVVDVTLLLKYDVQVQAGSEVTTDKKGITYGQSLAQIQLKDTIFTDEYGNVVPGTLSWKDPSYVPSATETTAVWVFTPLNDAFAALEGKTSITVYKKKTQMIETPTVETILTYGQKLADADITGGSVVNEKGESVSGTFEWKHPEQIPTAVESGKTKYEIIFKPDEAENYSECETAVTVMVKKAHKAPDMPEAVMTVPYMTTRLGEIPLPENWQWQTKASSSEQILEVGVPFETSAVYIGKDTGNYEAESVSVTITRSACTHSHTEIRDAKKATCTQDGYSGDSYCTDCGAKVASGERIEALGHKLTEVSAKEATAAEAGNKAYFVCESCGRYFADRAGTTEITDKSSVVIPAKGTTPTVSPGAEQPTLPTASLGEPAVPSSAPTALPSEPAASTAVPEPKGTTLMDVKNGIVYVVTSTDSSKPEVQYKLLKKKNAKKTVIPETVKLNGVKYAVTSVAKNAFKNGTKLKTIIVRSKKLTKKSIKKGAFKGISSKTVIKVPKKKWSAYKKWFRQKGLSKKVRIKKY